VGIKGNKWASDEEAKSMLRIKSKTTLQKFRVEGKIRITQPDKKIISFDFDSIDTFLNKHLMDTF